MAWKYKQEYVRDGDVVEPSEWRINVNEGFSEINGFLDSDNIGRDQVRMSQVKRGTFTRVYSTDSSAGDCFIFNHTQSGWIKETERTFNQGFFEQKMVPEPAKSPQYINDKETYGETELPDLQTRQLPYIQFKPDYDGLLIVEFCGAVHWMFGASHPGNDGANSRTNDFRDVDYRVTNDTDIGRSQGVGASYGFFAKQTNQFKQHSSYVLCSVWRLSVNGQAIAESGPIGNEYQSHPLYLCGATPISKNEITTIQLEAKFIWYSLGTDNSISASSFNPTVRTPTGISKIPFRRDCSLTDTNMVATFRKR